MTLSSRFPSFFPAIRIYPRFLLYIRMQNAVFAVDNFTVAWQDRSMNESEVPQEYLNRLCPDQLPKLVYVADVDYWGETDFETNTVRLCPTGDREHDRYVMLHEACHVLTGNGGHGEALYSVLLPLAKLEGFTYEQVKEFEQGVWWDYDLAY